MADQPGIQIDDDWKKQAQEEKRKLAEQTASAQSPAGSAAPAKAPVAGRRPETGEREAPQANFPTLVRSIMTQALLYLGELAVRGGQQMLDLEMAKYQIDLLGVLEEKTRGNLSPDEQKLLDLTLFDVRSRFVNTAGPYIM